MRSIYNPISFAICFLLISCGSNKLLTNKELKAKNYKEIRGSVPKDVKVQKAKTIKSDDQLTKAIGEKEDDESQEDFRLPQYPYGEIGIKKSNYKEFQLSVTISQRSHKWESNCKVCY